MIPFTLRQLEYFVAAAQQGGTAQAARALNVSQPSISQAISTLESHWQVTLFHRIHAQGLQLTIEGQQRYQLASTLLHQAQALSEHNDTTAGELHIGCLSTLGPLYLPGLLQRFKRQHPQVRVQFLEGDNESLLAHVERNTLQMALLYDTGIFNQVQLHPVAEQRPYVMVAETHPLAQRESIFLEEIASEPLLLINLPRSRDYLLSLYRHAGISPTIYAESSSVEMIRSMVANEMGLAVLVTRPAGQQSYDGKNLIYLEIADAVPPQRIVMASPMHLPLNRAAAVFLANTQDYFSQLGLAT